MKIGDSASLCYRLKTSGRMFEVDRWVQTLIYMWETRVCILSVITVLLLTMSSIWTIRVVTRGTSLSFYVKTEHVTVRSMDCRGEMVCNKRFWHQYFLHYNSLNWSAGAFFPSIFMSPKCPIRFNVSLLKWINLAKLPGWCEYLCALCLSDGARLPFFSPLLWKCVDIFN